LINFGFPLSDVAQVAVDHPPGADQICISDKFHSPVQSSYGFQRQIFVPANLFLLQFPKEGPTGFDTTEETPFPKFFTKHFLAREAQQFDQGPVDSQDLPRSGIQKNDPIPGRLEESPVALLGYFIARVGWLSTCRLFHLTHPEIPRKNSNSIPDLFPSFFNGISLILI
jgi:hypothetical protein